MTKIARFSIGTILLLLSAGVLSAAATTESRPATGNAAVRVIWPDGQKTPAWLSLCVSQREGDKWLPTKAKPSRTGNDFFYMNLPVGEYQVELAERASGDTGLNISGQFSITDGCRTVVECKATPVEVKKIVIRAVTEDGAEFPGALWYGRSEHNPGNYNKVESPFTLPLLASEKYWFRFQAGSSRKLDTTVSGVVPSSLADGELVFKVAERPGNVQFQALADDPADQQYLSVKPGETDCKYTLFPKLFAIGPDGKRTVTDYGHGAYRPTDSAWIIGVPDGKYELTGRVCGSNNAQTTVLATVEPAGFVVEGGKAKPAKVELKMSSKDTGWIEILVSDREGKPMEGMRVSCVRESDTIWSDCTDAKGRVKTPMFACDDYQLNVWFSSRMVSSRLSLRPGRNEIRLTEARLFRVAGRVNGTDGKPAWIEGHWAAGLDLGRTSRIGSKDGKINITAAREDFPLLLSLIVLPREKDASPQWVFHVVTEPGKREIVLSPKAAPPQAFQVRVPKDWLRPAHDNPTRELWFVRDGMPTGVVTLKADRDWRQTATPVDDKEMLVSGNTYLSPGRYTVLLGKQYKAGVWKTGEVEVVAGKTLELQLAEPAEEPKAMKDYLIPGKS